MKQRSLFGPLVLIATGVVWILVSMKIIPLANLWALTQIWPYVLIVLGLGMILRSYAPAVGSIVSILVVIGAVSAVVFAPQLGWSRVPNWSFGPEFGGGVAGSGKIDEATFDVADVHVLTIRYPADVVIRQGEEESITIEAEDNLIPQMNTKVEENVLVIGNAERNWSERVNPTETVKITIVVKDLEQINFSSAGTLLVDGLNVESLDLNLSGAGAVTVRGLEVDLLDTHLSGAGSISVEGAAEELNLHISGFGEFEARKLTTSIADISISGAGSATVRVEDELDAAVSGAGSIRYYGSPNVSQRVSGAGSVEHANE